MVVSLGIQEEEIHGGGVDWDKVWGFKDVVGNPDSNCRYVSLKLQGD